MGHFVPKDPTNERALKEYFQKSTDSEKRKRRMLRRKKQIERAEGLQMRSIMVKTFHTFALEIGKVAEISKG